MDCQRKCPKCGNVIKYDNISHYNSAVKHNRGCIKCAKKGIKLSEKTKKKMSIAHIGGITSNETKEKLSDITRLQWQIDREKMDKASIKAGLKIRKRPYEWAYNRLVSESKRRNIDLQLTYEEYLEFIPIHKCHYCEKEMLWAPYSSMKHQGSNLDRKDNLLGYSKENCVVCCYTCNTVKGGHFSYSEMIMLKPALMAIQQLRKAG